MLWCTQAALCGEREEVWAREGTPRTISSVYRTCAVVPRRCMFAAAGEVASLCDDFAIRRHCWTDGEPLPCRLTAFADPIVEWALAGSDSLVLVRGMPIKRLLDDHTSVFSWERRGQDTQERVSALSPASDGWFYAGGTNRVGAFAPTGWAGDVEVPRGVGMVSAIAAAPHTLHLGSYGGLVAVCDTRAGPIVSVRAEGGVTQLVESCNQRLLHVVLRASDVVLSLDARMGYTEVARHLVPGTHTMQKRYACVLERLRGLVVPGGCHAYWFPDSEMAIGGEPLVLVTCPLTVTLVDAWGPYMAISYGSHLNGVCGVGVMKVL